MGRALKKLGDAISWGYTMFFVVLGWLIFAFDGSAAGLDTESLFQYLGTAFGIFGRFVSENDVYDILRNLPFLALASFAATPYPKRIFYKYYEDNAFAEVVGTVACVGVFIICTAYIVSADYDPFLYFRF